MYVQLHPFLLVDTQNELLQGSEPKAVRLILFHGMLSVQTNHIVKNLLIFFLKLLVVSLVQMFHLLVIQ